MRVSTNRYPIQRHHELIHLLRKLLDGVDIRCSHFLIVIFTSSQLAQLSQA